MQEIDLNNVQWKNGMRWYVLKEYRIIALRSNG